MTLCFCFVMIKGKQEKRHQKEMHKEITYFNETMSIKTKTLVSCSPILAKKKKTNKKTKTES